MSVAQPGGMELQAPEKQLTVSAPAMKTAPATPLISSRGQSWGSWLMAFKLYAVRREWAREVVSLPANYACSAGISTRLQQMQGKRRQGHLTYKICLGGVKGHIVEALNCPFPLAGKAERPVAQ